MITRNFIEKSLGKYVYIIDRESRLYEGKLEDFQKNILILDNDTFVKMTDIEKISAEIIH